MPRLGQIDRVVASTGAQVIRLPLEVFPDYLAYAHLIIHNGSLTLVDTGSGLGRSQPDLLAALDMACRAYGLTVRLEEVDTILITHGHIDHFGGLAQVKQLAPRARVGIHELDRPVLISYEERVMLSRVAMADFLERAGVPAERRGRLLELYMFGKRGQQPVPVDFMLSDGMVLDSGIEVLHVPGHTPGLVMLRLGDVLLTADHVLPQTSVALAPESIMPYTGVGHYLDSLRKALQVPGVRVALGGHEGIMPDYYSVVSATLHSALDKIERVRAQCDEPRTIYEIATRIYGPLEGYGELLKLEQTGARIEYLHQRGLVSIANVAELEHEHNPVLRYVQAG